ncbi:MAG: hypothetical protein WBV45_01210 [Lutimonas sp.]
MKKIILLLVLIVSMASCDKFKKNQSEKEVIEEPEVVEGSTEENLNEIAIPDTELGFMVTYQGKYAGQEKLFENEVLAARLKKLDRFNYDAMLQRWNTETPIVIEEGILHMSGCKAHDCPSSAYDFFLDVENDKINIYNFRSNMLRIYKETDMIELPPGFATEMEIKKSNAKIGEIDDTESTYSLTTE